MKTIKSNVKRLSLIFAIIILQGCTVYKSANITLEEAYNAESVVRVKTKDNKTYKYDRVEFENDYFYGLNYKTVMTLKLD